MTAQSDSNIGEAARVYDDALVSLGVDKETIRTLHLLSSSKVKVYLFIRDACMNHRDVVGKWLDETQKTIQEDWEKISGEQLETKDLKERFPDLIRPRLEYRFLVSSSMLEYSNLTLTSADQRTAFLTEKKERVRWQK
nr:hypothetical protein [Ferrimicrobium acidiphilum]